MLDEIFESLIKLASYVFYHLFIEILFFYTGECILYVITFGKKKPRWDYYINEKPTKFVILTELSVWIGLFFWVLIVVFIVKSIF